MKVLVTGAAGRLGSCVCRILAESEVEFLAVDKFPDEQADYPLGTKKGTKKKGSGVNY